MSTSSLKIAILGSGNMGRPLGVRFAALGHPVFFGGRSPSQAPRQAAELASKSAAIPPRYGTLSEAAAFGDIAVWTIRETDVESILGPQGAIALKGKVVMDLNLRNFQDVVVQARTNKDRAFFEAAMGEALNVSLAKFGAQMVKVFTTIPLEHFALSPEKLRDAGAQTYIADLGGENSAQAKSTCKGLIEELGFETIDLGSGILALRILEVMGDVMRHFLSVTKAPLTTSLGFRQLPDPGQVAMDAIGGRLPSNYT